MTNSQAATHESWLVRGSPHTPGFSRSNQHKINQINLIYCRNFVLMAVLASAKVIKKLKKISRDEINVHRKFLINTGSIKSLASILSIKSELICRALCASGVI